MWGNLNHIINGIQPKYSQVGTFIRGSINRRLLILITVNVISMPGPRDRQEILVSGPSPGDALLKRYRDDHRLVFGYIKKHRRLFDFTEINAIPSNQASVPLILREEIREPHCHVCASSSEVD